MPRRPEPAQPPSNVEAEEALLGSVLLDPTVVPRVIPIVSPRDFYRERNGVIFETMVKLFESGRALDYLVILDELDRTGQIVQAGGPTYLASLLGAVPTPINAVSYAEVIANHAVMRRLISAGGKIATVGFQNELDPVLAVQTAENLLAEVLRADVGDGFVSQIDAINAYDLETDAKTKSGGDKNIIPTGLGDLDRLLNGGLKRQELIVLAARPSMGKSGLGLTICTNAALKGKGVAVFSLEMSTSSLVGRMMAYTSGVPLQVVDSGRWDRYEAVMSAALGRLASCPIWWNDMATMTTERMRGLLRRQMAQGPVDLVLIDHAQLLHGEGRQENRVRELTEITRQLKAMAKDLNVAVVLISQLSRAVEQRPNKRPIMADLRESGSLEQDADVVLLLYREEYYDPDTERRNIADLSVAKHRSGPTGTVSLSWNPETTGFWGLERLGL